MVANVKNAKTKTQENKFLCFCFCELYFKERLV